MPHSVLTGDVNAHSTLWHSHTDDHRGQLIADVISNSDHITLNTLPPLSIGLYILLFTMSTKLPYLDWNYQPLMDSFRAFKARIGLYFEDNNIMDDAKQSIKLKIACGDEVMRQLLASGLSDNELQDPKVIFDFLETQ